MLETNIVYTIKGKNGTLQLSKEELQNLYNDLQALYSNVYIRREQTNIPKKVIGPSANLDDIPF